MSVRPIHVSDPNPGGRCVLVKGNAPDVLARYRVPAQWSAMNVGWWLRRDRLADFYAQAEEAGIPVRVGGGRR